jgi:nucleoside 2-deoxyribosyltransferase
MLEGSAKVTAKRCVYDPQSAFDPEIFDENGSEAEELAVVANRGEIIGMTGENDPHEGARNLIRRGAAVVIVKSGSEGAWVFSGNEIVLVPPFRSDRVWTIGSGDVFAGMFAARWAVHRDDPVLAARRASKAVAAYAESMSLPSPTVDDLDRDSRPEATAQPGKVYLASPFFTMGQRWLVEEARRGLRELGLDVFSPVHDVGPGPAEVVAPADLKALDECDLVFAILDGNDSGTLFEVGYATAKGTPTYALAQNVLLEDLKMVQGSGAHVYADFVTALHHAVWRV